MIDNINTIHVVFVIITDIQSQTLHLMHRTSNRIKHRMNIWGPKNGNTTHGNKVHRLHFIIRISNKIIYNTDDFQHKLFYGSSIIKRK